MENASKALIIAGAILLAILLISLGILIFNQAQDTVSNSGMSQAKIAAHNNKFLKYEGIQKGSVVKSMISEALSANNDPSLIYKIEIELTDSPTIPTQIITDTSSISTQKKYKVEIVNYTEGYVKKIKITRD